jgi:hypothetical protein
MITIIEVAFGLCVLLLPLPSLMRKEPCSWRKRVLYYARALLITIFLIMVPLGVFLLSAVLTPFWKGGCRHGWLDCFFTGKAVLLPLVLWATAALFVVEVVPWSRKSARWVVLGLFTGVLVSTVCLVHVLVCLRTPSYWSWFLLVPIYVSAWYALRFWQSAKQSEARWWEYLLTALGTVPLWIWSALRSQAVYQGLSDYQPTCYVATAASRGHAWLVGPFFERQSEGRYVRVNRQLLVLWGFERVWRTAHAPSHRVFRRLYDRYGGSIARRISRPWQADIAYLTIKPAEVLASIAVRLNQRHSARSPESLK